MTFHYTAKIFTATGCEYHADGFFHSDREFIKAISPLIHAEFTAIIHKVVIPQND